MIYPSHTNFSSLSFPSRLQLSFTTTVGGRPCYTCTTFDWFYFADGVRHFLFICIRQRRPIEHTRARAHTHTQRKRERQTDRQRTTTRSI